MPDTDPTTPNVTTPATPATPAVIVPHPLDIAAATAELRKRIVDRLAVLNAERDELTERLKRLDGPKPRKAKGAPVGGDPAAIATMTPANPPETAQDATTAPGTSIHASDSPSPVLSDPGAIPGGRGLEAAPHLGGQSNRRERNRT